MAGEKTPECVCAEEQASSIRGELTEIHAILSDVLPMREASADAASENGLCGSLLSIKDSLDTLRTRIIDLRDLVGLVRP